MLPELKRLARQARKRLNPSAQLKFDIKTVPEAYQPLVRKIMASSPIWGAHQTIDFPNGFVLKGGRDQSRVGQFNLPVDLSGCSVVDIGCNIGGIALECKKRNAARVVGLDLSKDLLGCAADLAKLWNLEIEFRQFNAAQDTLNDKFDYVFFLNVFHHLNDKGKIRALRTLDAITGKRLFFEAPASNDIVAGEAKWLTAEDYVGYFKGFTSFRSVEISGISDFGRPVLTCER